MIEFDMSGPALAALCVLAVLALAAIIRPFRRGGAATGAAENNVSPRESLAAKEMELAAARENAARSEALADERGREIERLNGEITEMRGRLEVAAGERLELAERIARLETAIEKERASADEKIGMLTKLRSDMEARFRDLAHEALRAQGEALSKANLEKLEATLAPLKEHVGHFETELRALHRATVDDRAALKAEIQQMSQRSETISKEALALTRALRSDRQKQGAWGEMILEGILERSGLREGAEFEKQAHRGGADGERLRPDVVVNIPGGKTLVIDSKVSLTAYTDAVNAETDGEAAEARSRHVASLRGHIRELASKDYQGAENSTVDYVILFVPIEGALSEALREDGRLTEYALERHVTIATPTTLMMALRTVANVWAVERRNRNAEEIARRAGRLYDKVAGFVDNMDAVGKRLGQARDAYEDAFGQLSRGRGNVLSQIEALKELGAATTKSIGIDFEHAAGDQAALDDHEEGGGD